jgi:transposase
MRPLVLSFLQLIGPSAVFQDDNARPHRVRIVNDFVRTNNINRMDWSANSPDLNSIEHAWDELGRRVYRNNPPQTLQELRNRLMLEWQNMPQDVIRRCVDSMRKRCRACVAARGGHTTY